ncbi:MAG: hypothetical protein AAB410_03180 [Patescibacteria group bacterium]
MFSENQKKFLYVILALLLSLSAFLFLGGKGKEPKPEQIPEQVLEQQAQPTPSKVDITYLEPGKLAPELPKDLPLEEGAPPQRSEILKAKDGSEVQNVYRYFSKKTVEENFQIYEKYFKATGWTIKASSTIENLATLAGEKAGQKGIFLVSISKNSITNDVSVELNVVIRN